MSATGGLKVSLSEPSCVANDHVIEMLKNRRVERLLCGKDATSRCLLQMTQDRLILGRCIQVEQFVYVCSIIKPVRPALSLLQVSNNSHAAASGSRTSRLNRGWFVLRKFDLRYLDVTGH